MTTGTSDPEQEPDAVRAVLEQGADEDVRLFLASLAPQEVADLLETLDEGHRERVFRLLDLPRQAKVLREVEVERARDELIEAIPDAKLADIAEHVPSDDAADLVEALSEERRERVLEEIEPETRAEIEELGAYAPDTAGGLMQKELLRIRQDMTVREAIDVIRRDYEPKMGDVFDIYVVDAEDHVLGRVRNRHLLVNPLDRPVREFMKKDVRRVPVTMDQEQIAQIVADYDLATVAVVNARGRLVGRIVVDDVVDVLEEEATEDIQKLGGMEALGESYLHVRLSRMVRKRAGWLAVLFVGELLTASAMAYFEKEIARAVVLALFVPLIISSGGNSGSQATTLVIRAMALGEVRLRDWWRVVRREAGAGLALGAILGAIGVARILVWESVFHVYGPHHVLLALTVGVSLVGVVLCGTVAGATLPFALRRAGLDPASASAPFVATLVDLFGVLVYFTVAILLLSGTILA